MAQAGLPYYPALWSTAVEPRMYKTSTWGYGDRLPFDHHEMIAAIAARAVLIDNTNDDYADNAECEVRLFGPPMNTDSRR